MSFLGLFPLAFKRLRSRPWLALLLVLTTALVIGFTGSIPVFANAVSSKILQDEIDVRAHTRGWPIFSVRVSARPDARTPMSVPESLATRAWVGDMLRYWTALPLVSTYVELQSPMYTPGISCPHCYNKTSEQKKAALTERQRQVILAKQRGETHIGEKQKTT